MARIVSRLLWMLMILMSVKEARCQTGVVQPPQLKSRHEPGLGGLYGGFRQQRDSATVITVKFKLTDTGFLDTLWVSPNAPADYQEKIRTQLVALNGRWEPQRRAGKAEPSKWLVYRHYVMGTNSRGVVWQVVWAAYQRDYDLFRCLNPPERALQCLTPYVEGPDFFLFPPAWYGTSE